MLVLREGFVHYFTNSIAVQLSGAANAHAYLKANNSEALSPAIKLSQLLKLSQLDACLRRHPTVHVMII